MSANGRIAPKLARAAVLLAGGLSLRQTAKRVKVGERTLYRWSRDPNFAAEVAQLRAAMLRRGAGQLARLIGRAVKTLKELLESDDERIRLGAASRVLEQATRIIEMAELERRLQALEQVAKPEGQQ